jgi:hypothetical protein
MMMLFWLKVAIGVAVAAWVLHAWWELMKIRGTGSADDPASR